MAKEKENQEEATFNAKTMLLENGAKGTIIKYADRLKVEVVKETKHYKVGDILSPHKIKGLALIQAGIAKEVKE